MDPVAAQLSDFGVRRACLSSIRLSDAYGLLYNFAWSEVFDWYLEMAKSLTDDEERAASMRQTLGVVLRDVLKLFHPATPFVTEELWSHLGDGSTMLITSSWPESFSIRSLQKRSIPCRRSCPASGGSDPSITSRTRQTCRSIVASCDRMFQTGGLARLHRLSQLPNR